MSLRDLRRRYATLMDCIKILYGENVCKIECTRMFLVFVKLKDI